MTDHLNCPLPIDVDLNGMKFFPLEDERLKRSRAWLIAKRRPEVGFYSMNLWMRAWREAPVGSIDADDDTLADAALCFPQVWGSVRADVMRGWVPFEGRYYHPVVCEVAWTAWLGRLDARFESACRNWRKAADRAKVSGHEPPMHPGKKPQWIATAYPATFERMARLSGIEGHGTGANGTRPGANGPGDTYIMSPATGGGTKANGTGGGPRPETERPPANAPKVSEGKEVSPPTPPDGGPDADLKTGAKRGAEAAAVDPAWSADFLRFRAAWGVEFGPWPAAWKAWQAALADGELPEVALHVGCAEAYLARNAEQAKNPAMAVRRCAPAKFIRELRWRDFQARAREKLNRVTAWAGHAAEWDAFPAETAALRGELRAVFDTWLAPCKPRREGEALVLASPKKLVRDYVQQHLVQRVERVFGCRVELA